MYKQADQNNHTGQHCVYNKQTTRFGTMTLRVTEHDIWVIMDNNNRQL